MTYKRPTDEDLMAFADGLLPAELLIEVARMVEADPVLGAKVTAFRTSRQLVGDAFKPLVDEKVPAALEDAVQNMLRKDIAEQGNIVAFKLRGGTQRARIFRPVALAASFAAVVAGVGGYLAGSSRTDTNPQLALVTGQTVPDQLSQTLSKELTGFEAETGSERVRIIATAIAQDGAVCREFELDSLASSETLAGIACRRANEWRLEITVAAAASSGGFAPASSLSALDSYLQAIGAGEPLTPEQEKQTLR
jgi:hypothetical protein